jgi:hypothetical protein
MPGQRTRELIAPLEFDGGKTIVDDHLREVRPLFEPPRTVQRTSIGRAIAPSSTRRLPVFGEAVAQNGERSGAVGHVRPGPS